MLNTPIWEPPKWRDPVTKQGFCGSFFLVLGGWDYCFVLPSADLWVQWVLQQQWLVSGIGGCPSHFETKLFLVIDPFLLAKCHLEAAVVGPNQNQDVKGYKAKALFTSRLEVVLNIWIDFTGRLSTHAYLWLLEVYEAVATGAWPFGSPIWPWAAELAPLATIAWGIPGRSGLLQIKILQLDSCT